jgi:hypothetical protein
VLPVLDTRSEAQVGEARDLLAAIRDALTAFGASPADLNALAASIRVE